MGLGMNSLVRCGLSASVVLTVLAIDAVAGPAAPTAQPAALGQAVAVRDGSHDFDFIYGKWSMPNHRLKQRLVGSHDWANFVTCDEGRPLPGGIGNTDYWRASYWKDFVGVTVRTYDPKTGLWRIYWVDNTFSEGVLQPPVIGKFDGKVGIFEGSDTYNGLPVTVRFTWTVDQKGLPAQEQWERDLNPRGARVVAKWEQAFSTDGGKTWETNWYNEFVKDDHCTPTSESTPPQ